jgi:hypothetical protein
MAACTLAAVVCWACDPLGGQSARAGDVFRLGLNTDAPTLSLVGDRDDDTLSAAWRGYYGGYRGYYGGYGGYRGYYGSYYPRYYGGYYGGGYGGYYGSYYPRYYGGYYGSYYPRYYGGYYGSYYPRYYGGYYGSYYPYSGYYGYSGISYVSPIGCPLSSPDVPGIVVGPRGNGSTSESYKVPSQPLNPMKPVPQEGTFPYDGGPSNPVPMPKVEPAPTGKGVPTMPLEGRPVSLPAPKKYEYLAYGEKPAANLAPEAPKYLFAQDRIVVLKAEPAKKAPR